MIFDKNVKLSQIEKFDHDVFMKVPKLPLIDLLKTELDKRKWSCEIRLYQTETDLKKYCSYLTICILDENNRIVCEFDNHLNDLTIRGIICFFRHERMIGIDLTTNKDFLESLENLINQVKKYA